MLYSINVPNKKKSREKYYLESCRGGVISMKNKIVKHTCGCSSYLIKTFTKLHMEEFRRFVAREILKKQRLVEKILRNKTILMLVESYYLTGEPQATIDTRC